MALFATYGSFGILDTGATKSVIGSALVPDLLRSLHPKVRNKVQRCKCSVTFRLGNQGLLDSNHAIVLPIGNLGLKIAVVQGHTPLLLPNTLLRTLKSSIDVSSSSLHSPVLCKPIKLHLNSRGLFLVDLNELVQSALKLSTAAETFANCDNTEAASEKKQDPNDQCGNPTEAQHTTEPLANRSVQEIFQSLPHNRVTRTTMSLADRFERALERSQTYAHGNSLEEFKSLTFEEKCQQTVAFGKTHVGRTFLDMYLNEPKWMKWFLKTYDSSQKMDHQKLRHFVQIMVEQEERGETPPTMCIQEPSLQMPMIAKAKARPRDRVPSPSMTEEMAQHHMMHQKADEWSLASMAPESNEMITALQARMGHMENAMTEILNHIRVVLLRHQFSEGKHLHWEQTRKSLMFRTPLLSELYAHTHASNFDMCQVGELKDPVSQMLIQKSMTVRTTSTRPKKFLKPAAKLIEPNELPRKRRRIDAKGPGDEDAKTLVQQVIVPAVDVQDVPPDRSDSQSPTPDESQTMQPQTDAHGNRFLALPPEERSLLIRVHKPTQ
ncbi:unnamed protein product [Cladocopium goreaui]|uniref:Uncharacterized protein n=1 Tax=Cladocopium goreaui TaxID=2562237 RepID=A0A9P1GDE9_9DINO|nr:unnamed protein product [Cladocopium goreaui]